MIIVGSEAARFYKLNRRKPKDFDVFLRDGETIEELKVVDSYTLPDHIYDMFSVIEFGEDGYATPDELYTIKCSHLPWDVHWVKTKLDCLYMELKGCKIIPELYHALKEQWKRDYGYKDFLSLKMNKDRFFNDYVPYIYDHDYLHELVAHPLEPAYKQCLKDGEDVLTDYNKFCSMSFEDQVRMFREEITVIACERWLIPSSITSWQEAYRLALQKTLTRLTKNWADDFMVFNLKHLYKPKFEDFKYILSVLKEGEGVMSDVDTTVFEEVADLIGKSVEEVVYWMCENSIYFCGDKHQWENPCPDWVSRKENPEEWERQREAYFNELKELSKPYGYEHLQQEGGGEGGSEGCFGVFRLKGKIYRAEYSYYSRQGHDYEYIMQTLKEVKPVEKTITVYE